MIKTRVSFVSFVFTSQVYILADISTLFYERGRAAVDSNKVDVTIGQSDKMFNAGIAHRNTLSPSANTAYWDEEFTLWGVTAINLI